MAMRRRGLADRNPNPRIAVREVRVPATAGHGHLLTQERYRHVAQLASSAIRRHNIPMEIVEFNVTLKSLNVRGSVGQRQRWLSNIFEFRRQLFLGQICLCPHAD